MESTQLVQFKNQQFLSLETFRKSGQGVPTPVWFAEDQGVLYVRTVDDSGKVKRIRNNSRVRVALCDARGSLLSDWVEAQASLIDDQADQAHVSRLFGRKYGFTKTLFDGLNLLRRTKWITIAISLV